MLIRSIEKTGQTTLDFIHSTGRATLFLGSGAFHCFSFPFQFGKILDHTWFIGAKSIFVIIITAMFAGMVLGLQGYYSLVQFGSEALLGAPVALSLVRELGPVFTAIMITARAGSAMAAEIGVMRISEQIDALETMDIHPIRFIVSPRIVAAVISFPLLTALFDVVGIFGGYLTGSVMLGIKGGIYMDQVVSSVLIIDITGGFIKALVFSVVVTGICCYRGYHAHIQGHAAVGARGVSMATTNAVVQSCVLILITDFIITYFLV